MEPCWVVCVNDFPHEVYMTMEKADARRKELQVEYDKEDKKGRHPKRYVHVKAASIQK